MNNPLRRAAFAAGAAAACAAALAGCGATPTGAASTVSLSKASASSTATTTVAYPMTVKDGSGNSVTVNAAPTRIVSLSPTSTEDLYAVGAGSQVVAVDSDSDYPANAPRTSLSGYSPNIEAIAKYSPSLVITEENTGGTLVAALAKLGIPALVEPTANNLASAYDQINQIGAVTGHAAQAATVVSGMQKAVTAAVLTVKTPATFRYDWEEEGHPQYWSAPSNTLFGQLVGLFGPMTNIADKAPKSAEANPLTEEYIVTANPQIIFLTDDLPGDGGQTKAVVKARAGWSGVSAVQDGDVFPLSDDIASRWGPRLPELVQEIASAINTAEQPQSTTTAG